MINKKDSKAGLKNSPQKNSDSIEIRTMNLNEAIDVVRLIYHCYGDSYFYKNFYLPEHIAALNAQGIIKSLVAINASDEIIGHMTLFNNESIGSVALSGTKEDCQLGEPAMLMVRPDYRNQGILTRMMNRVLKEDSSYTENLTGLFCPPISEHVYSQLAMYHFGFKDCGCLLGNYPPAKIKAITHQPAQRVSLVLTYYSLRNPNAKVIYPPRKHKQIILNIYNNLGIIPHVEEPPNDYDDERYIKENSWIKAVIDPQLNNGSIKVIRYRADIVKCVTKASQNMLAQNTQSILLYLSLNDPSTYKFAEQFEEAGFFFAGILPDLSFGDALILQYLTTRHFDYNHLYLASKKAEEILSYVMTCEQGRKQQKKAEMLSMN